MKQRRGPLHRRVRRLAAQIRAAHIATLSVIDAFIVEDTGRVRAMLDALVARAWPYRRCDVTVVRALVDDLTIPARTRVYFRDCVMRGHINGRGTIVINGCMFARKIVES